MRYRNFVLFFLAVLWCAGVAGAHAMLEKSEPAVGSRVDKAPAEVRVLFSQELEPAFSTLKVFDESGKEVDRKDTHLDSKDKHMLIVSLPPLTAGTYKVSWRVLSVDTHRTRGDFKFSVR